MGENGCGKSTFMRHICQTMADNFRKNIRESYEAKGEEVPEEKLKLTLPQIGIAYKRQDCGPNLRKNRIVKAGATVLQFLHHRIGKMLHDRLFRLQVYQPLSMERIEKTEVRNLSGGQLQRLAIVICLGTSASLYLLDEPSAFLDCEQRAIVTKVMRQWLGNHPRRATCIVEHDLLMASTLFDRVITYSGTPGVACTAEAPRDLATGFNLFLERLDITLRRDPTNSRPRINKPESVLDREQKASKQYFVHQAADKLPSTKVVDSKKKGKDSK